MNDKKTNEYLLDKLKNDFQNIRFIIEEINISKTIILEKIEQTKILYQDLIKNNNTKIFIFCLDSLYFQYKLSLMDYDSMKKNFSFIMNRIYCDYYKLYNIIILEIKERCFIEIKVKTFQPYKDLDVLHEYSLETIITIHNEILSLIDQLYSKYRDGTSGIENHIETKKSVVSISNFLNTLKYENGLLENQIMLYINYMSFFHFSQNKMLVRLYSKMVEFNKNIDEYSNINNIVSIDDINSVLTEKEDSMSISISGSEYDVVIKNETNDFITPFRIEDPQSNRSNPFISAPEGGILNENWCKTPISDITENNSMMEQECEKSSILEVVKVVEPIVLEEVVEPIVLEEVKEPIVSEVVEEPIVLEVVEEPIVLEEVVEPIVLEEVVEPIVLEEVVEPIVSEVVEEPNVLEEVKEPIVLEEVVEPIVLEEVVEPIVLEVVEEPNIGIVEDSEILRLDIEPKSLDIIETHFDLISLSNSESDEHIYGENTDVMIEEFYNDIFPKEL